jgi:serine/threonine protein kinase
VATLDHPAIVPIFDFGEYEEQPYIVMRYMPGGSLAERIQRGPLSLTEAAQIIGRIAPALDERSKRPTAVTREGDYPNKRKEPKRRSITPISQSGGPARSGLKKLLSRSI